MNIFCDMQNYKTSSGDKLSGGQKQRGMSDDELRIM